MKKIFALVWAIALIVTLCSLLSACEKSYDDIMYDFYHNTFDGQFNAIKMTFGNNIEAVYFIEQNYGIWNRDGEIVIFNIDRTREIHGGGDLIIRKASDLSYYKAIVEYSNPKAVCYRGDVIFAAFAQFSEDETIATFSSDNNNIHINEISSKPNFTVKMTKIKLPASEIIPFDETLHKINFVPNAYLDFISDLNGWKISCKTANFWIDGSTMLGEWNTNGSTIPIRLKLHEKVPYVEIYDVSESTEKLILKSYANVIDSSSIELVEPEGKMFYTTPSSPVIIAKTD